MEVDISGRGVGPLGHGATGTIGAGGAETPITHAPSAGSISQTTAEDSPNRKTGLADHGRGSGARRDRIDAAGLTVESGHRPMTFILGHGTYDHFHARHGRLRACGPIRRDGHGAWGRCWEVELGVESGDLGLVFVSLHHYYVRGTAGPASAGLRGRCGAAGDPS